MSIQSIVQSVERGEPVFIVGHAQRQASRPFYNGIISIWRFTVFKMRHQQIRVFSALFHVRVHIKISDHISSTFSKTYFVVEKAHDNHRNVISCNRGNQIQCHRIIDKLQRILYSYITWKRHGLYRSLQVKNEFISSWVFLERILNITFAIRYGSIANIILPSKNTRCPQGCWYQPRANNEQLCINSLIFVFCGIIYFSSFHWSYRELKSRSRIHEPFNLTKQFMESSVPAESLKLFLSSIDQSR